MPRRSPIIFWLLLAATLALNLLAVFGLFRNAQGQQETLTLFLSLAYGQLSLACVWAMQKRELAKTRWLAPVSLSLFISVIFTWAATIDSGKFDMEGFATISCLLLFHVGLLLVLLWLAIPRRWIVLGTTFSKERRQFSTLQLLVLMTCVGVFLSLFRAAGRWDGEWLNLATFCFANLVLFCGTLGLLQARGALPLRLAVCTLLAIGIAAIANWTQLALAGEINVWAFFVIQVVVLVLWLSCYMPTQSASSTDSESTLPLGIA